MTKSRNRKQDTRTTAAATGTKYTTALRAHIDSRAAAEHEAEVGPLTADGTTLPRPGVAALLQSLGIADVHSLDVDRLWAGRRSRTDPCWAVVPVGVTADGELQELIFRAHFVGGDGFHSSVTGASYRDRASFFETLIYSIALTHSPEAFNIVYAEGEARVGEALSFAGLPHVVASTSGLASENASFGEPMCQAIEDELVRRWMMFGQAGVRDAIEYEEIRVAGADLEPCPILLVVIDDYVSLCEIQPRWLQLIMQIAQVGRGANVFVMLGGPRLDLSDLSKVSRSIGFGVALRAESEADGRDVIHSDGACLLPIDGGHALLSTRRRGTDGSDLLANPQAFRFFDMSGRGERGDLLINVLRESLFAAGCRAPRVWPAQIE